MVQLKILFEPSSIDNHLQDVIKYYANLEFCPNENEIADMLKNFYIKFYEDKESEGYKFIIQSNFLLIAKEIMLEVDSIKKQLEVPWLLRQEFSNEFYNIEFLDSKELFSYIKELINNDMLIGSTADDKIKFIIGYVPVIKGIIEENYFRHKPMNAKTHKDCMSYFDERKKAIEQEVDKIVYMLFEYYTLNFPFRSQLKKDVETFQKNKSKKQIVESRLEVLENTFNYTENILNEIRYSTNNEDLQSYYSQFSPNLYVEEKDKKILINKLVNCNLNHVIDLNGKLIYYPLRDIAVGYMLFMARAYYIYHNEKVTSARHNIKQNKKTTYEKHYEFNHRPAITMKFFEEVKITQLEQYFFSNRKLFYGINDEKSFRLLLKSIFTFTYKSKKKLNFSVNTPPFPTKII